VYHPSKNTTVRLASESKGASTLVTMPTTTQEQAPAHPTPLSIFPRSHAPAWERFIGRSASFRQADGEAQPSDAERRGPMFPRGSVGTSHRSPRAKCLTALPRTPILPHKGGGRSSSARALLSRSALWRKVQMRGHGDSNFEGNRARLLS
jgi:hypothetical protein